MAQGKGKRPPSLSADLFAAGSGGEDGLIHGKRQEMGEKIHRYVDMSIRLGAWQRRERGRYEIEHYQLCPKCIAGSVAHALELFAADTGLSKEELVEALIDAVNGDTK